MKKTLTVILMMTALWSVGMADNGEMFEWWQAQKDLSVMLMEKGVDITKLVAEMSEQEPANGKDAMMKVCVMLRAGSQKGSVDAFRQLKPFLSNGTDYQLKSIYYYVFDKMHEYDLAKNLVEIFADRFHELSLEGRLIKHLVESGWSIDQIDEWMAKMPEGKRNFWYRERFRFNVIHGRGDAYAKKEFEAVKKKPNDIDAAIRLLDSLCFSRHTGKEDWDLSWMPDIVKPKQSTQADKIAGYLVSLKEWPEALSYYELAGSIPLTTEETRSRSMMFQAMMTEAKMRDLYEVHIIESISSVMLELGRKDEAQNLMVKAADIREEKNLGMNAYFAGRVQGITQQRVMEHRIKKEEKISKDNPKYWSNRARYYRGRKEADKEEEALKKALSLTVPKERPNKIYKGYMDMRAMALNDYIHFLKRKDRSDEAVALIRKELKETSANSASSERAVISLAADFRKSISSDDELLWKWLEERTVLGYAGQRLLSQLLKVADKNTLSKHFDRAERIVGNNTGGLYELGWIMNRLGFPERSIPLLKEADSKETPGQQEGRSAFALFESYLDLGDWKMAEKVFPRASRRLTAGELPEWYGKIAVKAAEAGAKKDAMRVWERVVNVAPYNENGLDDLVKHGLKGELKKLYLKMKKNMPESNVPDKLLTALDRMRN